MMGSLVRTLLWETDFPFIVISPKQLKKFVTSNGNAPKDLILRDVYKRWGVEAKDNNQADACGLAYMAEGIFKCRNDDDLSAFPKFQISMIEKVVEERPHYNWL